MVNLPLIASFEVNRGKKTKPTKINKVVSCYYFKYKIGSLKLLEGKDTVQRKTKIFFCNNKTFYMFLSDDRHSFSAIRHAAAKACLFFYCCDSFLLLLQRIFFWTFTFFFQIKSLTLDLSTSIDVCPCSDPMYYRVHCVSRNLFWLYAVNLNFR